MFLHEKTSEQNIEYGGRNSLCVAAVGCENLTASKVNILHLLFVRLSTPRTAGTSRKILYSALFKNYCSTLYGFLQGVLYKILDKCYHM